LIGPFVVVAGAGNWRGRETTLFAFQRVQERPRLFLAHLARLTLRLGGLRGLLFALVRAGLGLSTALRLSRGTLRLLGLLILLLLLAGF